MAKARTDSALSPDEKKAARHAKKVAAFKKLGTKRVNKAMAAIAAIAPLSNRNSYTYDQAQVSAIFTALNTALKSVADSFTSTGGGPAGFTL